MGIKELGFRAEDGVDVIVIESSSNGVEYFLEKKQSGKYFIYRENMEMMLYPEDYGYFPIKTKKEIHLKPLKT